MVDLSDIVSIIKYYPSTACNTHNYAISGGSAVLALLKGCTTNREHSDIDIVSFGYNFSLGEEELHPLFYGSLYTNGKIGEIQKEAIEIQILRNHYFHCEIYPTINDVCMVSTNGVSMPVLSPEFLAISKLAFPGVLRKCDFVDIFSLNRHHLLKNVDYLDQLLKSTSLGSLIDVKSILSLQSWQDVDDYIDTILRALIRKFLYLRGVNVEALHPFQIFTLIDLELQSLENTDDIDEFVDFIVSGRGIPSDFLQVARLIIYFLLLGVPCEFRQDLIKNKEFEQMAHQLFFYHPNQRLVAAKTIFLCHKQLRKMEALNYFGENSQIKNIWDVNLLLYIMRKILFLDQSVFLLLAELKNIVFQLNNDIKPSFTLEALLSGDWNKDCTKTKLNPANCEMFRWLLVKRKFGTYPSHTKYGGKWLLNIPIDEADRVWQKISYEVEQGNLGGFAKITTAYPHVDKKDDKHRLICVYTYDSRDTKDVNTIREKLRDMGFVENIQYQTDKPM